MDSYRGHFANHAADDVSPDLDDEPLPARKLAMDEDSMPREAPPSPVGQDERRMQVRAYNFWASLLGSRSFPDAGDLRAEDMPDLAPYAVILDFAGGIEDPGVAYLGERIAAECGAEQTIRHLSDVPGLSLLSRITDHYMQILANEAPIGFEAEFINQRGRTIAYRGILLPFSSDGATISHILGVINWKELADQATTDALLAEVDKALAQPSVPARMRPQLQEWADGPVDIEGSFTADPAVVALAAFDHAPFAAPTLPAPAFGQTPADAGEEPRSLAGWLASARALAEAAHGSEDRSRAALYAAIGRAWDFALAARTRPDEFAALVAEAGFPVQVRAPMTPVVKLVFGADYDKTRLTEYATVLAWAQRTGIGVGALAAALSTAPGGLKRVVRDERALKRSLSPALDKAASPRETLARKLRALVPHAFASLPTAGAEFTVLVARRLETGEVVLLGEVSDDPALVERAARRLVA